MKVDLEKLKAIGIKHGIPAVEEILLELAFPLIEQVVAESPNKIDDVILAATEPVVKSIVNGWIEKIK